MSISEKYIKYLDHFNNTVTISDLWRNPLNSGLCGLRHDVDHNLDLALEMAYLEHQKGFRTTYFVLPGTDYWENDSWFIDKCLQLQDYGHEVGLHINSLVEWVVGETDDINISLSKQLAKLRDFGVNVRGIAAHGDKRCYLENVSNYWCFQELKPNEPFANENGRTAEGPYEMDTTPRLKYPKSDQVTRQDGSIFDLWSISLLSHDLDYHAWHVNTDAYFTDSGGRWLRSLDPLSAERNDDSWQVLIHPEHWQGSPKLYFFLSPARSGSKWLTKLINEATPIRACHEHLLNQDYSKKVTARKNTSNIWMLEDNPKIVKKELVQFWEDWKNKKEDIAEVNVYLPVFADYLKNVFPEAQFVHLKRREVNVIDSLIARNWYDTPEDHAHPRLKFVNPRSLSQFERVCFYVLQTNKCLNKICDHKISLEKLNEDIYTLQNIFRNLDVPLHPRLASYLIGKKIDPSKTETKIAGFEQDSSSYAKKFKNIFNKLTVIKFTLVKLKIKWLGLKRIIPQTQKFHIRSYRSKKNVKSQVIEIKNKRVSFLKNLVYNNINGLKFLSCKNPLGHSYFSFFGCYWQSVSKEHHGIDVVRGNYISGEIKTEIQGSGTIKVYGVSFGKDGKAIYRQQCGMIDQSWSTLKFAFAPHPEAINIDVLLYLNYKTCPTTFRCCLTNFFWNQA